jgi:hypothetical protein
VNMASRRAALKRLQIYRDFKSVPGTLRYTLVSNVYFATQSRHADSSGDPGYRDAHDRLKIVRRRHANADGMKFISEIEAKQRNTVWPDTLVNSRGVDELLWKGSPYITTVQRIGVALFGLADLVMGFVMLSWAKLEGSLILRILSIGLFLLAARMFRNAFRKHGTRTGLK